MRNGRGLPTFGSQRRAPKGPTGHRSVNARSVGCCIAFVALAMLIGLSSATAWHRSVGEVLRQLEEQSVALTQTHDAVRRVLSKQAEMVGNIAKLESDSAGVIESHLGADLRKLTVSLNDVRAQGDLLRTTEASIKSELVSMKHSIENILRNEAASRARSALGLDAQTGLKPLKEDLDVVSRQLDTLAQLAAMIRKQGATLKAVATTSEANRASVEAVRADVAETVSRLRKRDAPLGGQVVLGEPTAARAAGSPPLGGGSTVAALSKRIKTAQQLNAMSHLASGEASGEASAEASGAGAAALTGSSLGTVPPAADSASVSDDGQHVGAGAAAADATGAVDPATPPAAT